MVGLSVRWPCAAGRLRGGLPRPLLPHLLLQLLPWSPEQAGGCMSGPGLLTSSRVPSLTILQRGQPGGRLTSGDRGDRPLLVSAEDVPADVPTHQLSVSSSQPPLHPLSLPRPGSPPKNRLSVSTGPFCFSAHPPKVSCPSKVQRKPAVSLTSLCPPGWPPLRHEPPFWHRGEAGRPSFRRRWASS